MIRVLDARQLGVEAVVAALARPPATIPSEILRAVDAILADVRARGDAALLELTARFDGFTAATPTELVITPDEFEMAERQVAPDVRAALAYAAERIERRSEEHTSELQSRLHLVCRLLLEKKKTI